MHKLYEDLRQHEWTTGMTCNAKLANVAYSQTLLHIIIVGSGIKQVSVRQSTLSYPPATSAYTVKSSKL